MSAPSSKTTNSRTSSIVFPPEPDPRATDFDAFYESWYPKAVSIARRGGLPDPEAAAQECMMVFLTTDYLERHDPTKPASFDTWVGNILYRRMVSMQRTELRRRSIASMQTIGERDFEDEGGGLYGDFKQRMLLASEIIKERHPESYLLWKSVVLQVLRGRATAGDTVDRRELAARAGMTQFQLEAEIDEFIEMVSADHDLADLLGVDRSPISVS